MRGVVLSSIVAVSFLAVAAACASSPDDTGSDQTPTEPVKPAPTQTVSKPPPPPKDSGYYAYDAGYDSGNNGGECDMSDFAKLAEWGQELASGNAQPCPCASSTQCCFLGQICVTK